MVFDDLADNPDVYSFYGVFNNYFKLGDTIFHAIEDEADGYRSYLETVALTSEHDIPPKAIFFKVAVAYVAIRSLSTYNSSNRGYELYSPDTGHVWLTVCTEDYDDYYPCFRFSYTPDPTQQTVQLPVRCPKKLYPEYFI